MDIDSFIELAWEQFDKFGLTNNGWAIETNPQYSKHLGVCFQYDKVIVISEKHIEQSSRKDIKDTLLHEIGHALVGPGFGHGPVWQRKAIELGIIPSAFMDCQIRKTRAILA